MEKKLIAPHVTTKSRPGNLRHAIYGATIFLSFHFYFVIYINSSFLGTFAPAQFINLLYILGASLNIFIFFLMPAILKKYGNFRVLIGLILIEMVALIGLASSQTLPVITGFFIIQQALPALLWFSLDVFLERCSKPKTMGTTRGIYMTFGNCIVAISPIVVGTILQHTNFQTIYLISFLFLVPLFFLATAEFKNLPALKPRELEYTRGVRELFVKREVGIIFFSSLLLQIFYAIMVIYMPLYLSQNIGMSWESIGLVFTIMLLPFLLFELPLGTIADKRLGEKEILITGFLIMAVSTLMIPYLSGTFFLPWAIILFITRTGASFVEIANETYFFKKIHADDTSLMSLYRAAVPLSYIIGPIGASVILLFFPRQTLFTVLGILMIVGMVVATKLRDTR